MNDRDRYVTLGRAILKGAYQDIRWYSSKQRVAQSPMLSHSAAQQIIRLAKTLGIEDEWY